MNQGTITRERRLGGLTVSGLRTRFFPKSRLGHGLVSVAPWLNIVLLLIFFALLGDTFMLQPGVVVELPSGPFREGIRSRLVAVILSIDSGVGRARDEIVFFDDERFLVKDEKQMTGLKDAFARRSREHHDAGLVIHADADVRHGTVVRMLDMARDVGIKRVGMATRDLEDR